MVHAPCIGIADTLGKEGAMKTIEDKASHRDQHAAPREAWDAIAEGYDRYVVPQEADLANEALGLVGLRPGERFLDVAAGPGGLALPAARLGARVLATDWSAAMIARFEARVRELRQDHFDRPDAVVVARDR